MPEFRKDIILDEWVIIAKERAKRPQMFKEDSIPVNGPSGSVCPFDAGNEEMTPPEILRMNIRLIDPSDPHWQIRVVPNKFPALKIRRTAFFHSLRTIHRHGRVWHA
jgi:UDPglucose--hexose-1-phosphate uridylyltransferase